MDLGAVEKRSICIYTLGYYIGENEHAKRIVRACDHLGWDALICEIKEPMQSHEAFDWVLTLCPGKYHLKNVDDYLLLFAPCYNFFCANGNLRAAYRNYTGYLTTYADTKRLVKNLRGKEEKVYNHRWYPTVQFHPYRVNVPDKLFYLICNWGNRNQELKYQKLVHYLDQQEYTLFYGPENPGVRYDKYRGKIPFDGVSVLNEISKAGICLVLHSDGHLKAKIPSGRIFEAAAASAVIISDRNPFVVEHFGDAVLYVDQELSGEEMFDQIHQHMQWILENQEEALKLARHAHDIFVENFLLEDQLLEFDRYRSSSK